MEDMIITESMIKERIQKALNGMILRWLLTLLCIALTAYALIQAHNDVSPKFISHDELKILFLSLHTVSMLTFANICVFIFGRYQNTRRILLEKPYDPKLIVLKSLAIPLLPVNIIFWVFVQFEMIACFSLAMKV